MSLVPDVLELDLESCSTLYVFEVEVNLNVCLMIILIQTSYCVTRDDRDARD